MDVLHGQCNEFLLKPVTWKLMATSIGRSLLAVQNVMNIWQMSWCLVDCHWLSKMENYSSSPLQNNPIETTSTQWNKKIEWLKKIWYHSNTFDNNFPFEFYKSHWGILSILGKISISVFIPSVHRLLNFKKKGWHVLVPFCCEPSENRFLYL